MKHSFHKYFTVFIIFFLPFLWPGLEVSACTLWAAAGSRVQGGGVLIAKNRDMPPDHRQELRLVKPRDGFRYFGLFAVDSDEPGVKAGVNEKGLVIVDAAASCLPRRERQRRPEVEHLNEKILSACADVDAVLRRQLMFLAPAYYLVADRTQAVLLEVTLTGARSLTRIAQGTLSHTNHYLRVDCLDNNRKVNQGSRVRLKRIRELLALRPQALTLTDCIGFSRDRHDGPDHSIWRTGSTAKKIRTLASWIVRLPPDGPPSLYVKLANPGEPPSTRQLQLHDSFWGN